MRIFGFICCLCTYTSSANVVLAIPAYIVPVGDVVVKQAVAVPAVFPLIVAAVAVY